MEKTGVYWLLGIVGSFCGVIIAMVGWYASRMHDTVDKIVDKTNENTTVIAVEQSRNDDQDDRLDKHDDEIHAMKEKVWQVTYKRA